MFTTLIILYNHRLLNPRRQVNPLYQGILLGGDPVVLLPRKLDLTSLGTKRPSKATLKHSLSCMASTPTSTLTALESPWILPSRGGWRYLNRIFNKTRSTLPQRRVAAFWLSNGLTTGLTPQRYQMQPKLHKYRRQHLQKNPSSRRVGGTLKSGKSYTMDEDETPLSPTNVTAMDSESSIDLNWKLLFHGIVDVNKSATNDQEKAIHRLLQYSPMEANDWDCWPFYQAARRAANVVRLGIPCRAWAATQGFDAPRC